jgi:pimeloyl-ACP methyl ester carboxylesterase
MRYRRLGAGPPLVLLGPADGAESLAARYRVIVPEMPGPGEDFGAWLTAFLEGLGTSGVTVVAAEPFHTIARELALADPDRVAQVLVPS